MRRKCWALLIPLIGLTGCASVPEIPAEDYVTVSDILYSSECELKESIDYLSVKLPFVTHQLVALTYTLRAADSRSGSADANLVVPVTDGTFSLGLTGGLDASRSRTTSLTVTYDTGKLRCPAPRKGPDGPNRIEGGIGLKDWLLKVSQSLARVGSTPRSMTYELSFDIVARGGAKPGFSIGLPGVQYGVSIGTSGSHQRAHSVLISVAEVKEGNTEQAQRNLDQSVQQFLLRGVRN